MILGGSQDQFKFEQSLDAAFESLEIVLIREIDKERGAITGRDSSFKERNQDCALQTECCETSSKKEI